MLEQHRFDRWDTKHNVRDITPHKNHPRRGRGPLLNSLRKCHFSNKDENKNSWFAEGPPHLSVAKSLARDGNQRKETKGNIAGNSNIFFYSISKRDLLLEFRLSQWIEEITGEEKPQKISFEDWISDGTVLSKWGFIVKHKSKDWNVCPSCLSLMRSLSFNSVENDFSEGFGGSDDLAKWRVNNVDGLRIF